MPPKNDGEAEPQEKGVARPESQRLSARAAAKPQRLTDGPTRFVDVVLT